MSVTSVRRSSGTGLTFLALSAALFTACSSVPGDAPRGDAAVTTPDSGNSTGGRGGSIDSGFQGGTGGTRGSGGATAGTGGTTTAGTGGTTSAGTGGATTAGTGGTTTPGTGGAVTNGDAGSSAAPVRFAVVGDYGVDNSDEAAVAKLIASWNPDFVITTGDNNYPDGAQSTIDNNIGKYFHDFIGNYVGKYGAGSPTNRFWPSAGNHDWVSGLVPYTNYFTLPGNERYYDVDLGLVHLYAVDSDPNEPDGTRFDSKQGKWLQDRLAASRSCYDVVYFHHPPYNSGHYGPQTWMQWPFGPWGAEAVMSGHEHLYERLDVGGVPYFIAGGGGAGLYPSGTRAPQSKVLDTGDHGAMLVIATKTGITYEFWTPAGRKVDSLTVPKSCGP